MSSAVDYIDRIEKFLDNQPEGQWIDIAPLVEDPTNPQRFIDGVKILIDFDSKPYEFNPNYTKVRRIEYVATKTIKPNQNAKQA